MPPVYFRIPPVRRAGAARAGHAGFTLIELVIVLVLLGAIAAVALPRLFEGSFRSSAFAEQTASALRYAQRLAVASGCEIEVEIRTAGGGGYALRRRSGGSDTSCGPSDQPFTVAIPSPTGGDFEATASGGVEVTQGLTIVFDAQGLPVGGGGTAVVAGRSLVVDPETGLVR